MRPSLSLKGATLCLAAIACLALPAAAAAGEGTPFRVTFNVEIVSGDPASEASFVMEVHPEWSPIGVGRFEELLTANFFADLRFFRVVKNFMVRRRVGRHSAARAVQGGGAWHLAGDPLSRPPRRPLARVRRHPPQVQFGISGDPLVTKKWRAAKIQVRHCPRAPHVARRGFGGASRGDLLGASTCRGRRCRTTPKASSPTSGVWSLSRPPAFIAVGESSAILLTLSLHPY